jgi:hypothetical protein
MTETRIRTYTHSICHLLLRDLLIPSDLVKCFTARLTKTEKLRNDLISHCDPFGQILRPNKATSKRTFFFSTQRLYVMCEEIANYLEYNFLYKLVRIVCIITLPANLNSVKDVTYSSHKSIWLIVVSVCNFINNLAVTSK